MTAILSRGFDPMDKVSALWCSLMHGSPMWPIHGHYECRECGRRYRVPWDPRPAAQVDAAKARALPSALVPMFLLAAVLAWPGHAAETRIANSSAASAALARFTSMQQDGGGWSVETIEIEASLPRLSQHGKLRAVRRILPLGQPHYQVLEMNGDSTVRQQVIVRYLSADAKSRDLPASSVAITPANYKFRYIDSEELSGQTAHLFRITPRQKREGLLNGLVWVSEDGVAIRESGYLVKSPSIFIKRVNVTRENEIQDGVVEAKVTHVAIDTRLVGRAELVITERPSDADAGAVEAQARGVGQ